MLNKKSATGGLVLAGLAAFAYYKYSRMSDEQKKNIVGDLKEKGKKLYDQYAPQEVKDFISKKQPSSTAGFDEGQAYGG